MLTGVLAARNLDGEGHDLAAVHAEPSYLEGGRIGDRGQPSAAAGPP